MSWGQEGLSEAGDSRDSVLKLKSFRETFKLSLKRFLCSPTLCMPWRAEVSRSPEEQFWYAVIWHAGEVSCPSQLVPPHDDDNAREVGSLQDLRFRDFVLLADAEEVSGTYKMEVVELFCMLCICGAGFGGVE